MSTASRVASSQKFSASPQCRSITRSNLSNGPPGPLNNGHCLWRIRTVGDAPWLVLVTAAAADTAARIYGGVGGAPQSSSVPQPLDQTFDLDPGGDYGGVSSPVYFVHVHIWPARPVLH